MRNNKGFVFVILFLLAVAIAAMAVTPIILRGIMYHSINYHEKAFYIAESGMRYYIKQLTNDNNWIDNGTITKNFAGGTFTVQVIGPAPREASRIILQSTGTIGPLPGEVSPFYRVIQQTVVRQSLSPWQFGAVWAGGTGGITVPISGMAYTDSYDSSLGRYNVNGNIGNDGDVVTNGDISISGLAHIGGDAQTGAAGTFNNQSAVSGTISHNFLNVPAPVTVPTDLANMAAEPAFSLGGQSTQGITGNHKYPSMTLSGQSVLTVTGPSRIYLTESSSLTISGQAKFAVSTSSTGPVIVYADGNVSASGQGITNDTYIPSNFQLYGTGTGAPGSYTYSLSGQSAMYGAVYAPNANMTVSGQGGLYGAVVGNDMILSGMAAIHFDEQLKNISVPGSGGGTGGIILQDWKEI